MCNERYVGGHLTKDQIMMYRSMDRDETLAADNHMRDCFSCRSSFREHESNFLKSTHTSAYHPHHAVHGA